ncbi:MFS transporter [Saccharothrix syringae]|uniref:MFS transporter n=1 Tax=Saccharothrix syringae TaxID=103733 RepID=A0A5Q0GUT4_SACSY|nr:MFS transporter [Saccharothrix syringae]QFZ17837.1 MFS transporter [Saccharothrix syringae]
MALDTSTAGAAARTDRRGGGLVVALAVALASLTLPLAVTPPGVALNAMAADLGASPGAAQWMLNAYNVTFAAFMLAAGGLADLFGRKRVLTIGLWVFGAMSLLCAVLTDMVLIDVARGLQGIGAAGVLTSGAAVLAAHYTGPARTRAFGMLGASFGFGLALGPLVAGFLVDAAGWQSVFWMNVVIVAAALLLSRRVPESSDPGAERVDWAGVVTFTLSLFLLTLAFVQGPATGWTSWQALGAIAGFLLFLALFVVVELRQRRPLFDLSLFRRPTFIAVVCQPFTITFGFVVLLVFLPPYFQGVGGVGAAESAAVLLPLTLPVLLIPLVAGSVAARVPLRVMLGTSSLLIAAGSLWLVVLDPAGGITRVVAPLLVVGIGVGSAFGVMDNAAVSVVPPERAGMASGIFNTMRITGEGIAIAGAASLLATLTASGLGSRLPGVGARDAGAAGGEVVQGHVDVAVRELAGSPAGDVEKATALADSLTSAMHTTFIVLALLALAGSVATFLVIRDRDLNPRA